MLRYAGSPLPPTRWWWCGGSLERAACPFGMQHVAPRTLWDAPSQFNHACNKGNQWKTSATLTLQTWEGRGWWEPPEKHKCNSEAAQRGLTRVGRQRQPVGLSHLWGIVGQRVGILNDGGRKKNRSQRLFKVKMQRPLGITWVLTNWSL